MTSPSAPDDEALLTAWSEGDRDAGMALVKRHYDAVFAFFASKVEAEVAGELTQDTFMVLTEAHERFQRHSSVRTYMFAIARFKLVEHFRRQGVKRQRIAAVETLEDRASPPAESGTLSSWLEGRRRESLLVQALRSLPLDDQILLELKSYEELSLRELGEVFQSPTGTIASRVRRARQRLEQSIRELADNPELADETLTGVETYMRAVQAQVRDGLKGSGSPGS